MRQALIAFFFLSMCSPLLASAPDIIASGISLPAAKATLQKHDYEVRENYALAMVAPKGDKLEFCKIDNNITLIIQYNATTQRIVSLGVVIFPDNATSKLDRVFREALEIAFDRGGIYTLKLKRVTQKPNKSDQR